MGDMGDVFRAMRERKREVREVERAAATSEILALREEGFRVDALTEFQFRIDGRLDFYPTRRRYHVLGDARKRGSYGDALATARRILRNLHWLPACRCPGQAPVPGDFASGCLATPGPTCSTCGEPFDWNANGHVLKPRRVPVDADPA